MNWKALRTLGYGFLLGTAGVKILSSEDAKKVYTHVTAAVMRCTDSLIVTANNIKENCQDIAEDAKDINEERYAKEEQRTIEAAKELLAES